MWVGGFAGSYLFHAPPARGEEQAHIQEIHLTRVKGE